MAHLLPLSMNFTSFNLRNFKLFINMDLPLLVLSSCPPWSDSLSLFFKGFIFKLRSYSGLTPKERHGYPELLWMSEANLQKRISECLHLVSWNLELIKFHYLRQVQEDACSYHMAKGILMFVNNLHSVKLFLSNLDFPNNTSLHLANRITMYTSVYFLSSTTVTLSAAASPPSTQAWPSLN